MRGEYGEPRERDEDGCAIGPQAGLSRLGDALTIGNHVVFQAVA